MPTYYVDNVLGNDANAGTSPGGGNALATINIGLSKCTAAGDILEVQATGTDYGEIGNITSANGCANGTSSAPCIVRGRGGVPTINGGNSRINCLVIARNFWRVSGFTFTNCTARHIDNTAGNLPLTLDSCSFIRGGSTSLTNFFGSSTSSSITVSFRNCSFDGSSSNAGIFNVLNGFADGCVWKNLSNQAWLPASNSAARISRSTFYNASGKFFAPTGSQSAFIDHCSFDTGTDDAIDLSSVTTALWRVTNCVFANFAGASKAAIRGSTHPGIAAGSNAFYNCTANYAGSGFVSEGGDVQLPALPWAGSGDFTPNAHSRLLKNAGLGSHDIGARGILDVEYPIPIAIAL